MSDSATSNVTGDVATATAVQSGASLSGSKRKIDQVAVATASVLPGDDNDTAEVDTANAAATNTTTSSLAVVGSHQASVLSTAQVVDFGHHIVLYSGFESMWSITVQPNKIFSCLFGNFKHESLVGKHYGEKYILRPSPELWTRTLGRRTQIIYTRDISMITFALDLKPGSVVVESGTGSGSFSTSLARTVAPTGHLHTFEFHEERAALAKADFERLGLAHVITVKHSDVLSNGFQCPPQSVDAVFLDLPQPEKAVEHAAKVLKFGVGRLCSFSPCIEQVQRTCEALRAFKFHQIETIECLLQAVTLRKPQFLSITAPLRAEQKELLASEATPMHFATQRTRLMTQTGSIRGHTSYLTFASMTVPVENK